MAPEKKNRPMRARFLTSVCASIMLASSPAIAQSSPNWSFGYVPTAGQWNAAFARKQDFLGFPPLNSNGGSMTGELYTFPSSALNAGLNLGVGNSPTFCANGDVWMTNQGLFDCVGGMAIGPLGTGGGGGGSATYGIQVDPLTVTATNVLSNLTKSFNGQSIQITVNGASYSNVGSFPAFSVSGAVLTWNATNAGITLSPGNTVFAVYTAVPAPVVPALGAGVSVALQNTANVPGGIVTYPVPGSALASGAAATNGAVPHVANITALLAYPSTYGTRVHRDGYTTAISGGGADYDYSASPCSLYAGAGDNGSQVAASGGGCWIVEAPVAGLDLLVWGADPTGATFSTTALQNAANYLVANGGIVRCRGSFKKNATITLNGSYWKFLGAAEYGCTITETTATEEGFAVGNSASVACCTTFDTEVSGVYIVPTLTKTGGAGVHLYYTYHSDVNHVTTTNQYVGIQSTGGSFNHLHDNTVSSETAGSGIGIKLEKADVATIIDHNNADASNGPLASLWIGGGVNGSYIHHNNFAHAINNLYMDPSDVPNSVIANMFFEQNAFDSSTTGDNAYISCDIGSGSASAINRIKSNGDWFSTSGGGNGLNIRGTANCAVSDVNITAPQAYANYLNGIMMQGVVGDIDIVAPLVSGNSQTDNVHSTGPGTYHGINVNPGVSHWSVQGGRSKVMDNYSNTQGYAVVVQTGASDYYRIVNVDGTPNVTGNVLDLGTGTHKCTPAVCTTNNW